MPSVLHESHLFLFRNQPALAADLIRRALGVALPAFAEARVGSAELTEVQPAEYRADMVIELWNGGAAVYGIVLEVQLAEDKRKRFTWPAYVANLRAKLRCPVSLLVITVDDAVARWAGQTVTLGGQHVFTPYVLGPSGIPEVTDDAEACENPELAVLSAMAHGRDSNAQRALEIASAAQRAIGPLDADRSKIYLDLIMSSLGEAARQALSHMDARTYEYQSDFARRYIAEGRSEGVAEGRVEMIVRMLTRRFGTLDESVQARVQRASKAELEGIADRLLTAPCLQDALGPA
jgi:hypothetical protein